MSAAYSTMSRANAHGRAWRRPAVATIATAAALYVLAALAGLVATSLVRAPLSEGSSYYVDVARNVVSGRGLVIDAIWSYATPPLTLPRQAFELWQPMASFVAAAPMSLLGTSYNAAQLGFVLLGALLAPLAWLVARDTARLLELDARRSMTVELGAALLTALSTPLLLSVAAPDSTLPFAVLGVGACLLMARVIAAEGGRVAVVALGVTLGLAYLTRMEAVWLGLAFVIGSLLAGRPVPATLRQAVTVALVAAVVALPWWLRNLTVFGTPLPSQVTDNMFLTRNEQIFAYLDPPTLGGFLAQGVPGILGNIAAAAWHNLVDVLVVAGGPLASVGLLTVVVALVTRRRAVPAQGPLALLLLFGAISFAATTLLFPVATLWGTFEHAAGPLHVALIVAAVVGMDALVARVRAKRDWPRSNSFLAPAALALVALPLCAVALLGAARAANQDAQRIAAFAGVLPTDAGPIITDHPIWLSAALNRQALALPDEPLAAIEELTRDFHAVAIIVTEPLGAMPAALRTAAAQACFGEVVGPAVPAGSAVFVPRLACR